MNKTVLSAEEQADHFQSLSPVRVNNQTEDGLKDHAPAEATKRNEKPFLPAAGEDCDGRYNLDPEVEGAIGSAMKTVPIPAVSDPSGSSSLVTGSSYWTPQMGAEKFFLSQCREWKMSDRDRDKTELVVAPQWSLSPAVAPGTFQRYMVPFPQD